MHFSLPWIPLLGLFSQGHYNQTHFSVESKGNYHGTLLYYLRNSRTNVSRCSNFFYAAVTYIDSSAIQALKDLHQEYKSRDIQVKQISNMAKCQTISQLTLNVYLHYKTTGVRFSVPRVILQIAIANPNQEVMHTLARSGVIDLIGKEWYFVRMHDAVQVCLQHVQKMNGTPKGADATPKRQSGFLQRLWKEQGEEESNPEKEPLLSSKV